MKKLSIAFALVLALVLCVFCFASCGKKTANATTAEQGTTPAGTTAGATTPDATTPDATTAEATTAEATTPEETEHVHVPGAEMVIDEDPSCAAPGSKSYHCTICGAIIEETVEPIPALPHTPEDDYTIDEEPTCVAPGKKSIYCLECGQKIPGETADVEIPIDPDAHLIDPESIVIVEPTLLNPEGTKTGVCALCDEPVVYNLDEEIFVIDSKWDVVTRADYNLEHGVDWLNHKDLGDGVMIKESINKIKDEDEHYFPTDENPEGNDLLVEISFLWNETLSTTYSWEAMTFGHIDGYDVFNVDSQIHPKDNRKHDGVLYEYNYVYPTEGTHTPSIGEYGWHRLGFRVHEDAAIVDNDGTKEVKYTYLASCYLDGTLMVTFDLTDWVIHRPASTVTALLYTAEIDAEDDTKLNYFDIGDPDAQSNFATSYGLIYFEDFFKKAGGYFVFCDLSMTCGQDFVQDVEANADPADATFTIDDKDTEETDDDVVASAKIWYKAK